MQNDTIYMIGATIISLLLAGNIFFIKRLVDKIETTGERAGDALRATKDQALALSDLKHEHAYSMAELRQEIKDMRRLEIDVAVLKSAISYRGRPKQGREKEVS